MRSSKLSGNGSVIAATLTNPHRRDPERTGHTFALEELLQAGACRPARRLPSLAVDVWAAASGGTQLPKPRAEHLCQVLDAGTADELAFGGEFRSYLTANVTP